MDCEISTCIGFNTSQTLQSELILPNQTVIEITRAHERRSSDYGEERREHPGRRTGRTDRTSREVCVVVHSTTKRSGGVVIAAWGANDVGGWTRRQGVDDAQVVVQLIHVRGAGGERFEACRHMESKKLVLTGEVIHGIRHQEG
jgi:hypothetical protein